MNQGIVQKHYHNEKWNSTSEIRSRLTHRHTHAHTHITTSELNHRIAYVLKHIKCFMTHICGQDGFKDGLRLDAAAAAKLLSRVWLFATPWMAAHQAPPSMGFSRHEYWSGCHCLLHGLDVDSSNGDRFQKFVNIFSVLYFGAIGIGHKCTSQKYILAICLKNR